MQLSYNIRLNFRDQLFIYLGCLLQSQRFDCSALQSSSDVFVVVGKLHGISNWTLYLISGGRLLIPLYMVISNQLMKRLTRRLKMGFISKFFKSYMTKEPEEVRNVANQV